MKKALITGITGQDGSYLAELLLAKGYEVHGVVRRASSFNTARIDHLYQDPQSESRKLHLHFGDLSDGSRLASLISEVKPDEIYNLAAQSHVKVSFEEPLFTGDVTGLGSTRLLEALVAAKSNAKFYQASSSEMFGNAAAPQSEKTVFEPRSPYAISKLYSHWTTVNYREAHGIFAVSGILFNHESPRRGPTFLTRKVSRAVSQIKLGTREHLYLGNLDARRDWGYAPEYVIAMWKMLQLDNPKDFVIGTGQSTSVREFVQFSFEEAGLDWQEHVRFDKRYLRPTEVEDLCADPTTALGELDWKPTVDVELLAKTMVRHDILSKGSTMIDKPLGDLWAKEAQH